MAETGWWGGVKPRGPSSFAGYHRLLTASTAIAVVDDDPTIEGTPYEG